MAVALATVLVGLMVGGDRSPTPVERSSTQSKRSPRQEHGIVSLRIPEAGDLLVALPAGWGISRATTGILFLASPRTCHTATLTAFVDRTAEPPAARAVHLLGYMIGRAFDGAGLWRGTTAGGRGYAVYAPPQLLGVESVRRRGRAVTIVVHGLPTHARCSAHDAAAPRWELSRLVQDLRLVEPQVVPLHGVPPTTA